MPKYSDRDLCKSPDVCKYKTSIVVQSGKLKGKSLFICGWFGYCCNRKSLKGRGNDITVLGKFDKSSNEFKFT